MHVIEDVVLAVWAVFWLGWLAASFGAKASRTRPTRGIAFRVVLIVVVLGLLRAGVFRGHAAAVGNPAMQGIGLGLFLGGLAFAVWARVYIGTNWGTPMSQKADPELVTTGPYRRVRHPIYSGMILAMIGSAVAVSLYWLVAVAVLGTYFIYSATVEERNMSKLFPESYPAYKRSTKMLVPFIF